jgi:hypothetical protein
MKYIINNLDLEVAFLSNLLEGKNNYEEKNLGNTKTIQPY